MKRPIVGAVLLTAFITGCGSTASPINQAPATGGTPVATTTSATNPISSATTSVTTPVFITAPPITAPPTTVPLVAHVGATITVSMEDEAAFAESKANVRLVAVIDPAQGGDQYTTPDAGKRFVGLEFEITAGGAVKDDANNDASVTGTDGQTYTADFNAIAGCTNFNDGQISLNPGQSSLGCVTFQIPTAVKTKTAQFGTQLGTIGQWEVP